MTLVREQIEAKIEQEVKGKVTLFSSNLKNARLLADKRSRQKGTVKTTLFYLSDFFILKVVCQQVTLIKLLLD